MITINLNDLTFYINNETIERELGLISRISSNEVQLKHKSGNSSLEIKAVDLSHHDPMTEGDYVRESRKEFLKNGIKLRTHSFKKIGDKNILFIRFGANRKYFVAFWYPFARPGWVENIMIEFNSAMRESYTIELLKSIQIDKTSDRNITEENNSNLEDSINPISEN